LSKSLTKTKLIDPLILTLLQNIRGHRSKLKNLNSLNIDSKLSNIVSNEEGKELFIENEFHKAKGFRKLHIEIAEFSKNLKILHCVFFPDPKYDIPIKDFLTNTEEAILKGVINSLTGVINSLFNPEKDILIICGGDSQLLTKSLKTKKENIINAPNLVMEGMIIHHLSLRKLA